MDTELGAKDLLNNRMAYVSVSRGQWDAQIFTNDRSALANALGRDISHESALRTEQVVATLRTPNQGQMHEHARDLDMGMGLGL